MANSPLPTSPNARPDSRVVDLAAYRAARALEDDALPLFARSLDDHRPPSSGPATGSLSDRAVAHRERMLRHLAAGGDRT